MKVGMKHGVSGCSNGRGWISNTHEILHNPRYSPTSPQPLGASPAGISSFSLSLAPTEIPVAGLMFRNLDTPSPRVWWDTWYVTYSAPDCDTIVHDCTYGNAGRHGHWHDIGIRISASASASFGRGLSRLERSPITEDELKCQIECQTRWMHRR